MRTFPHITCEISHLVSQQLHWSEKRQTPQVGFARCPLMLPNLVPGKVPELPVQFLGLELHLKADKKSLQCSGGTMNLYEACKVCFKSWSLPIY